MSELIDTEIWSARYREKSVDLRNGRLLIANFLGSEQEKDFSEPTNCQGVGRIRHFKRETTTGWPPNPLPIDPSCRALEIPTRNNIRAQVFQNAACNWRCWYCFVPFDLLSANASLGKWLSPAELVDLYLNEPDPPPILDLTGGQPDLVPEWVLWTIKALKARGCENSVYLWSDDNLSNDYLWRFLSSDDLEIIANYPNYGRVGCFKGFNGESFSFNTRAEPSLFNQQFDFMRRLFKLGIDLYAYVTLTSPSQNTISNDVPRFIDRLQEIHEDLPLRTVPLEIRVFTPVVGRLDNIKRQAMTNQYHAVEVWQKELQRRFSNSKRDMPIVDLMRPRQY